MHGAITHAPIRAFWQTSKKTKKQIKWLTPLEKEVSSSTERRTPFVCLKKHRSVTPEH
jgi:hypothetical protein